MPAHSITVDAAGFEPVLDDAIVPCSQITLQTHFQVEVNGIEPMTYTMPLCRSPN